ncbi:non-lysosomal glucosylceramidase [Lycorma delicatula]|uniref:non-lysosomal glucosylceramidase n=1 Tax=Lycorma delicatula TaxID=130591 RepID=UPI003F5117EC
MRNKVTEKPKFGWTVKMNHIFPNKTSQKIPVKFHQMLPFIPLFLRYIVYYIWKLIKGQTIIMDFLKTLDAKQISGVPLGGIGGGIIGRGWKGEFCNYSMRPGMYEYTDIPANQFIVTIRDKTGKTLYQKVLSPNRAPKNGRLSKWSWEFPGEQAEYTALFPRSWTEYNIPEYNIKLTCRQVSPVIPHNYLDSCLPGGVFIWDIENSGSDDLDVSITFTFKNGVGTSNDSKGNCNSEFFDLTEDNQTVSGIVMNQNIYKLSCAYTLAALQKEGITVTRCPYFNPKGKGGTLWNDLLLNGKFIDSEKKSHTTRKGEELGVAVCTQTSVSAGSTNTVEFSLVWDMPKIFFHGAYVHRRYYTKVFGKDGRSGPVMSQYALKHYKDWEKAIFNWQTPIQDDMDLPDWYKSAIFNEAYYVVDGGTVWLLPDESEVITGANDPRKEYGRFGYLEGHEYRMYNTYDVHFYASFTLAQLWPLLQASIQYDFRDTVFEENTSKQWFLYDGKIAERKVKCSVPHDLGDPVEEPFRLVNAYNIHDISEWRDLNLKFVLQCYRDYNIGSNINYLKDMWPQLLAVVKRAEKWDVDGDGLIENSNSPDQTYDTWIMNGSSAYCSSLWIGVLYCISKIAELLDDSDNKEYYEKYFEKAKESFQKKLWNGQYYDFDSSKASYSSTIMADQLCGLWYLRASGVKEEVIPNDNVKSVLNTVYEMNVKKFCNGEMGAVNGMKPDGVIDTVTLQSEEVWTGVTYGLAAFMIHEGMVKEGFHTASGIYNTVYNKIGLGFQTPEALFSNKTYRSVAYMRPLSIWAMQLAWKSYNKSDK